MPPRSTNIEISFAPGVPTFARRFERFISDLTDLAPAFAVMAEQFYNWETELFDSEGASGGAPWAPLKESTIARKATQYPHAKILEATGRLRESLTSPRGAGAVHSVKPEGLELGTDVIAGKLHQEGTRNMVARPVIQLTMANKAEWTRIIHRHLVASATGRLAGGLL